MALIKILVPKGRARELGIRAEDAPGSPFSLIDYLQEKGLGPDEQVHFGGTWENQKKYARLKETGDYLELIACGN